MTGSTTAEQLAELDGSSASRELVRACHQLADQLVAAGSTPDFTIRSTDSGRDPRLICATHYWRRRLTERPTVETAARCGQWLVDHADADCVEPVRARWAVGGFGFVTRDSVESPTEVEDATSTMVDDADLSSDALYFALLYHAGKLRSNYSFTELHSLLESSTLVRSVGDRRDDPHVLVLRGFACLGNRAFTPEYSVELLDRAWRESDSAAWVMDTAVNALFAAPPFDGQGVLLRKRAAEAVSADPGNSVFRYRLARGCRLTGDFDNALTAIAKAIELLSSSGTWSHRELQAQYLVERDAVLEDQRRARWLTEQKELVESLVADNAALRETVQTTPVRTIEVVALFSAAITFAVGTPQIVLSGNLPLGARAVLMAIFGGGALLFALLIVFATWYITRVRRSGGKPKRPTSVGHAVGSRPRRRRGRR